MLLVVLAFFGGALTILSPCILPVLPFVFARSDQSFVRSTLPLLGGMALTFAGVATLAAVGGAWAVGLNTYGRLVALAVLALLGVALISERFATWLAKPFVALGNRLSGGAAGARGVWPSVLLGVATGLVWAPCAGPILGLILTGAAIDGPSTQTTLLLFSYSLGAIASLAVATLAGARVFAALKRSLSAGEWIRRGLGAMVLLAVVAIMLGWDTGVLTRLSYASTNRVEQKLIDAFGGMPESQRAIEGELPSLAGATGWLNSEPLTAEGLRGKVVLIDFWTYSCINCLRALPYVKAWYARYRDSGFVVIGVHSPEFAFEKDERNVRRAIDDFDVQYPVALDNDFTIWRAFENHYWPAHYFVDAKGQIRGHHFGEGNYDESERLIRELLMDAGARDLPMPIGDVESEGVQSAAAVEDRSPETYLGYGRAERFLSPGGFARDTAKAYSTPDVLDLDQWAMDGTWKVGKQAAALENAPGALTYVFHARDLHLVLGPGPDGKPIRFRVTLDGKAPGKHRGMDVNSEGSGVVTEQRLYQLIRQDGSVGDRKFSIQFEDPGVQAFAFTFG